MIPQSFVQDLLNRLDIVDVVDRYVPLKKAGANYVACCPFHSEKSPSFSVSPTKQFYHCFGCGAHGSAIGFVMEHQGLGFVEAVEELARSAGLTVPKEESGHYERKTEGDFEALSEAMQHATHYYRDELKRSEVAIAYLKKRGLSGEIAARFGIGYAPGGWQNLATAFSDYQAKFLVQAGLVIEGEGKRYDRFRDRIMFPILNQKGAVIGFGGRVLETGEPKYLNSPETPLFEKGRELYGLFQARQAIRAAGKVIVVEGYMDVVALAQHGVEYAVATLGTATTPVHVQKLLRQTDNVVFCFDGDTAGRKAAWRALENSLALVGDEKSIKFLFLPQGEDPDSYIRKEGKAAFEALLESAMPMSEFLLRELAAGVDMQTMEGRAHFLKLAQPLAQQVAAPALRLMLQQRLAELAGVSRNELEGLIPVKSTVKPAAATRTRSRPSRKPPSLARKLLQLLLVQPELGAEFDMSLLGDGSEELKTLSALLGLVSASHSQPTTTVAVLERFRGTSHEALLSEVSGEILQWDVEFEVAEEFAGALEQLKKSGRKLRIESLLALSSLQGLSPEEKQELQRLLQGGSASTKSDQFTQK